VSPLKADKLREATWSDITSQIRFPRRFAPRNDI